MSLKYFFSNSSRQCRIINMIEIHIVESENKDLLNPPPGTETIESSLRKRNNRLRP